MKLNFITIQQQVQKVINKINDLELLYFLNSCKSSGFHLKIVQLYLDITIYIRCRSFEFSIVIRNFNNSRYKQSNSISIRNYKTNKFESIDIMPYDFKRIDGIGYKKIQKIIYKYTNKIVEIIPNDAPIYFEFDETINFDDEPSIEKIRGKFPHFKNGKFKMLPQSFKTKKLGYFESFKKFDKKFTDYSKYIVKVADDHFEYNTKYGKIFGLSSQNVIAKIKFNLKHFGAETIKPEIHRKIENWQCFQSVKVSQYDRKPQNEKHIVKKYIKKELELFYNTRN